MHRKYTAEEYADYIANLREAFVNPAVTTDVIAGFQGETEEEHQETLQFLQQIGFAKLHVFPYSKREGTVAARMQGDLPGNVKKRRAAEMIALGEEMSLAYKKSLVGSRHEILLEQEVSPGICEGYIERYIHAEAPGNPGDIVPVEICGVESGKMICRLVY